MPTAVEMILRLEGIAGQSADHNGSIEVLSFSFGVAQAERGTNGGAGKSTIGDLVVVKALDKASPSLFLACAKGTRLTKGEFVILPAVQDGVAGRGDVALYRFSDVIVESVRQMGNEHAGTPTEEVTLEFGRLESFTVGDGSV